LPPPWISSYLSSIGPEAADPSRVSIVSFFFFFPTFFQPSFPFSPSSCYPPEAARVLILCPCTPPPQSFFGNPVTSSIIAIADFQLSTHREIPRPFLPFLLASNMRGRKQFDSQTCGLPNLGPFWSPTEHFPSQISLAIRVFYLRCCGRAPVSSFFLVGETPGCSHNRKGHQTTGSPIFFVLKRAFGPSR